MRFNILEPTDLKKEAMQFFYLQIVVRFLLRITFTWPESLFAQSSMKTKYLPLFKRNYASVMTKTTAYQVYDPADSSFPKCLDLWQPTWYQSNACTLLK